MTEKILLRTMTLKSKFTEGKYAGKTVDDVINKFNNKNYLRYLYYNIQNINFNEEVLGILGIKGGWVIDKPGVKKGEDKIWMRKAIGGIIGHNPDYKSRFGSLVREHKIYKKNKIMQSMKRNNFTKGQLQAINHGR